jgi:nucleotide-binding universal stress UspA family protein
MSWLVGVDLRLERVGVLKFAAWLHALDRSVPLVGIHVVESDAGDAEVKSKAMDALRQQLERLGLSESFASLRVVEAPNVDEALHEACDAQVTTGLIVGRRVGLDEPGLVRIGAVTRRLLRTLPLPILVVPPDVDPSRFGTGPVVWSVRSASEVAHATFEFASRMATSMGRELDVVAIAPPLHASSAYMPSAVIARRQQERTERTRELMDAWMCEHDVQGRLHVLPGQPMEQTLAHAERVGSPLIVCSRNKSNLLQRYLGGTASTDLVTHSRVPVAVVADGD